MKIRIPHRDPKARVFSWMVLIMGTGVGMIYPILPNFIKTVLGNEWAVSVFYAGIALVMCLAAAGSTVLFSRYERAAITKIGFLIMGLILFLMIFVTRVVELAIFEAIRTWCYVMLMSAFALFVRDFANSRTLGEEEGMYYRYHNIGFLIGPLLGGILGALFYYEMVFIMAALLMFGGLIYFYHNHTIEKNSALLIIPKSSTKTLWQRAKTFFSNAERGKIYLVSLMLHSWFNFKYLYIPLYVVAAGYLESITGIIFALSIIPLIVLEVRVGKYADKKGVALPIHAGFLIIALSLLLVALIPYAIVDFLLFILISVGVAFVEPLQEYYLFRHMPQNEENELYGIYKSAETFSHFLPPLLGAIVLVWLPFNALFMIFGLMMLTVALITRAIFQNSLPDTLPQES